MVHNHAMMQHVAAITVTPHFTMSHSVLNYVLYTKKYLLTVFKLELCNSVIFTDCNG